MRRSKVGAVAWREFKHTALTKAFIIGAVVFPIVIWGAFPVIVSLTQQTVPNLEGTVAILDPTGELVRRMEETGYERIELEDAQPGDVICYGLRRTSKFANHLAVRTDYGIIHTDAHAGAVVEVHFVDEWVERARHAYVFPGVDEPWRP